MESDNHSEALLRHLEACEARELAVRREHFSGEWSFNEIDHHGLRDWARMVGDNPDFSPYEKSIALRFVGAFAYYSEGYNVAVTTFTEDGDRLEDKAVHLFIPRLEARMLARVVYRYESDEHTTLGLKLGHRICRHVHERKMAKGEAA